MASRSRTRKVWVVPSLRIEPGCTLPVSSYTWPGFAAVASCDGARASLEAEKLV